jgi:DNA-directed RNA polymerase specialized sigma24 family protein
MSRPYDAQKILDEAYLIVLGDLSIRDVCELTDTASTTIWWHVSKILPRIDKPLYDRVQTTLKTHKN